MHLSYRCWLSETCRGKQADALSHSSATDLRTPYDFREKLEKDEKIEESVSPVLFAQTASDKQPWATQSLWLKKTGVSWWFKQMSEYTWRGPKNNSSLSRNSSTAVSPCLPVSRLAEMLCGKAHVSVQYLPWKPSSGASDFCSAGLCALYPWYRPLGPGRFWSRCPTVGYSTGQLKQHLQKTNYIRNRTSVFLLCLVLAPLNSRQAASNCSSTQELSI